MAVERMSLGGTLDGHNPDIMQLPGVGWYKDIKGNMCFPAGKQMVVATQTGVNVTLQLLTPGIYNDLWDVSWEETCITQSEMADMAAKMVQRALSTLV